LKELRDRIRNQVSLYKDAKEVAGDVRGDELTFRRVK
jgi:hypothetical protein